MMEITGVKVRLIRGKKPKVKAFCTVTFDGCFVVKDIKVIAGDKGEFIAMPSRKISERCGKCDRKNPVGASYCNSCGGKIQESKREPREGSLYSDIAHPINAECRSMIQDKVVEAYRKALEDDIPLAELADEPEPVDSPAPAEPADEPEPVDSPAPAELADEPEPVDSPAPAELADEPEPVDSPAPAELADEPEPVDSPAPDDEGDERSEGAEASDGSFSEGIL